MFLNIGDGWNIAENHSESERSDRSRVPEILVSV